VSRRKISKVKRQQGEIASYSKLRIL